MKNLKLLVIIAAVIVSLSAAGLYAQSAGSMFIAPKAQLAYGFGDAHDFKSFNETVTINPGVGGGFFFGYYYSDSFAMEGDVSFLYWFTDTPSGLDYTVYAVPFYFGLKFGMNPMFGIIAGIGAQWDYRKVEIEGFASETKKKLWSSFYAGVEINFQSVIFRPKFVYVYASKDPSYSIWFELGYMVELTQ